MPDKENINSAKENFTLAGRFKDFADKVLAMPNNSFQKTVAVALALCLVSSIVVSGAAVLLKPLQQRNKALDMKKNILGVVGLLEEDGDIEEAFKQIEIKIVDLQTGDYVDNINPESYDQRKAARDQAQNMAIPADKDMASIKTKAKFAKVYLVKENQRVSAIILPVHGYGLWSTMYGFLAVEGDGQTIIGLNFYDQAETPGLGGEVVNPSWRALWRGKKVFDANGKPAIGLIKGSVDPSKAGSEFQVDGLAGATLTSNGVTNLLRYWLSQEGFASYLEKIRSERG